MYHSIRTKRAAVLLAVLFSFAMILLLLFQPQTAADGIVRGLKTCSATLIPALFPFIFFVDLLFSKLCALRLKSNAGAVAAALAVGLVGGFPVGAKALADLRKSGLLSEKKAAVLLTGSVNAGPAFLISGVGLGLFGNTRAGVLLFVALTVSSLICMLLFSLVIPDGPQKPRRGADPPAVPDGSVTASMSFALSATLKLCGFVVLFSCFGAYITVFARAVSAPAWLHWLLQSLIEVVGGCRAAAGIGSVGGILLAGASVSLCSLSIGFQILSLLRNARISMRYFLLSRPLHLALTVGIVWLLIPLFPQVRDVFAADIIMKIYNYSPLFSLFFILVSVIFVLSDTKKPLYTNDLK